MPPYKKRMTDLFAASAAPEEYNAEHIEVLEIGRAHV